MLDKTLLLLKSFHLPLRTACGNELMPADAKAPELLSIIKHILKSIKSPEEVGGSQSLCI